MDMSRISNRCRDRRGLALVTVLWVLMLLSLMAASFMKTTRTEVNITRNLIENAEAEALADAGVYLASRVEAWPPVQRGKPAPVAGELAGGGGGEKREGAEAPSLGLCLLFIVVYSG